MIGKSLGSCDKFIAVLPVMLIGINGYEVFTNQFFELGLILEEVALPYQLTNLKQFLSFGRKGSRTPLGLTARLSRGEPYLKQAHRNVLGVGFRVEDACASAHHLYVSGFDLPTMSLIVLRVSLFHCEHR